MKNIGFENFRKFKAFPTIALGDINYMVGTNNSGKSTLVKAILMILDYLQNQQGPKLFFDDSTLNKINIVTYGRALCNMAEAGDLMKFNLVIGSFFIEIVLDGQEDNSYASVLSVKFVRDRMTFEVSYQKDLISLVLDRNHVGDKAERAGHFMNSENAKVAENTEGLNGSEGVDKAERAEDSEGFVNAEGAEDAEVMQKFQTEKKALEQEISAVSGLNEKIDLQVRLNDLLGRMERYRQGVGPADDKAQNNAIEYPISESIIRHNKNHAGFLFGELIDDLMKMNARQLLLEEKKVRNSTRLEDMKYIDANAQLLDDFSNDLKETLYTNRYFYLSAHSSSQMALFNLRDKNNVLARAIHQYFQLKIDPEDEEYLFVQDWMKRFEIGTDFKIIPYASEAYSLIVEDEDGEVYLGDKGMGSIQAMTLFLRLATIIRKYRGNTQGIILMVEEPELNLHPKLQSLLTDLFFEINRTYQIRFIIETHSEYVLRRSQVIVANLNYASDEEVAEKNPFKVYFFPLKRNPYSMGYKKTGRFINKFDQGFFDEAGRSNIALIRKERGL